MTEPADWKRVGELLQQQRVRLDPRFRNRTVFADERGINYKLVQDIEKAARDNFDPPTLTYIELAYGLEPGTIEQWRAGTRDGAARHLRAVPDLPALPDEPTVDAMAEAVSAPGLTDDQRETAQAFFEWIRKNRKHSNGEPGEAANGA